MAIARHQKRVKNLEGEVALRSASEMDFFRGQEGHVLTPDLYDDGDSNSQSMRKLKAFLDVGETETMSKERWGAAKWKKGQLRVLMDNSYNVDAEPSHDGIYVEHKEF